MFSVLKHVPLCCEQMVDQRGVVAAEEVLPEALKRAASAAGVSPRTSLEGIAVGGGRGGGGGATQEWQERGPFSRMAGEGATEWNTASRLFFFSFLVVF